MRTDVAIRSSEVPGNFAEQMRMATALAESTLLPAHLRGKPANVLVVLQGARALDVSAFWAFQSMHVVEGKLGLSAELMRALVIKAGHKFTVVERTAQRAVVELHRHDREKPYRAEFTADDARLAELAGKGNWKKYPKSMLVARATSIAVRDEAPEVMFGMVYTPDELGAETDRDGIPLVDAQGRPVVDGQVVTPPTAEQIIEWAEQIGSLPVDDLPKVWVEITERASQFALPAAGDDSLYDLLIARVVTDLRAARCRPPVRELYHLARITEILDAKVDHTNLRDLIVAAGEAVPEECPTDAAEDSQAPAEGGEPAEPSTEAQGAAEVADVRHLTVTGVPHRTVCDEVAANVPVTALMRKATCPKCVPVDWPEGVREAGGPDHYAAGQAQALADAIGRADWGAVREIAEDPYTAEEDRDHAEAELVAEGMPPTRAEKQRLLAVIDHALTAGHVAEMIAEGTLQPSNRVPDEPLTGEVIQRPSRGARVSDELLG